MLLSLISHLILIYYMSKINEADWYPLLFHLLYGYRLEEKPISQNLAHLLAPILGFFLQQFLFCSIVKDMPQLGHIGN